MKPTPAQRINPWITGAAAGLVTLAGGERLAAAAWIDVSGGSLQQSATLHRFARGYDHVLGTSLDFIIEAARPAEAFACERQILAEIERLRRICSTYDPQSEIRRVMAGGRVVSAELAELLDAYTLWGARTGGLINANLGAVIEAWREASRTGRRPTHDELATAPAQARALNVDALGKSFILDRAVAVARRLAPGGLLNLGGDLRAWGDTDWTIAIADPRQPAENAPALSRFTLRDGAAATSGGYARFLSIGGQRFSHLIDPRTREPLAAGGSATVVAADGVTANALATAASIAGPETGAKLAQAHGARGWLLAAADGTTTTGGILSAPTDRIARLAETAGGPAAKPAEPPANAAAADTAWPAGFHVALQIALKKHVAEREVFRPYLAVWIEDSRGQVVRTLTVWGTDDRWQRKLSKWNYQISEHSKNEPAATARATRPPGTYTLMWDGKNDLGKHVAVGTYKMCLEICREDGHHVVEQLNLVCGAEPVVAAFRETAESAAAPVTYGPPKS